MKRLGLALVFSLICSLQGLPQAPAEEHTKAALNLSAMKVIYVLPMKDRMDSYLTAELVKWGRYEVTLNPKQADAIFSDFPQLDIKGLLADPSKLNRPSKSPRGVAFLIDPKSEKVIWSTSKDLSTSYLIHTEHKSAKDLAHQIVGQLKKDTSKHK